MKMSKKKVSKKAVKRKVEEVVSEEASPLRCNRRLTHKQVAHIPGPRRKPNYKMGPVQNLCEVGEGSGEGAATAEPEPVTEAPQPGGMEKPMCFGDIDG
jgi:hypothetical protein